MIGVGRRSVTRLFAVRHAVVSAVPTPGAALSLRACIASLVGGSGSGLIRS